MKEHNNGVSPFSNIGDNVCIKSTSFIRAPYLTPWVLMFEQPPINLSGCILIDIQNEKIGWWSKYKSIIQHIPLKRSWRFQELTAAAHHCCWLLGFSHWKRIERRRTESSDVNAKRKHVCKLIFVSISSSRLWSHQGFTRAVVRNTPMGVMDEVMTSLVYVKIFEMRKFCICL